MQLHTAGSVTNVRALSVYLFMSVYIEKLLYPRITSKGKKKESTTTNNSCLLCSKVFR